MQGVTNHFRSFINAPNLLCTLLGSSEALYGRIAAAAAILLLTSLIAMSKVVLLQRVDKNLSRSSPAPRRAAAGPLGIYCYGQFLGEAQ